MASGLFVGLATLDLLYRVDALPQENQKVVAKESAIAAGGPATNAAVTFAHLGNSATLLAAVGTHAIANLIRAELQPHHVQLIDLTPDRTDSPAVSSILVTAGGDRAVVSINAVHRQVEAEALQINWLDQVDVVLVDGHQMAIGAAIAQAARARSIPVVVDAGSWKAGFEQVLSNADYAICSANFLPPNCHTAAEIFEYLAAQGVEQMAITQGDRPILWRDRSESGKIAVAPIDAIDTSGAGDIFHGAFCHFLFEHQFEQALTQAAIVAGRSCQFFGTRSWITQAKA
ncbi:sugar kinase [Microcoleus sp. FACHB-1515]|uniref:PfkB family carbohydrate kinase n=1 Tax=Cyanophyceae TaxID=3028117 RepID=UPI001685EB7D|nr:PfkB family carbohydrate kinase [Microcoleus sp. FACHB-1515]MBD2092298.1 sugar kinase [Microcoleus sp. FACHB-1515]